MLRFFTDHPLARLVAALGAVAGILSAGAAWRWHVVDEREAAAAAANRALQEAWLAEDRAWNDEIIGRLRHLELICNPQDMQ